jgi:hypothetical protein
MCKRAVAQFGSALDWGSRGRRFKSCQPDMSGKRRNKERRSELEDRKSWRRSYRYVVQRVPGRGNLDYVPMSNDAPLTTKGRYLFWGVVLFVLLAAGFLIVLTR